MCPYLQFAFWPQESPKTASRWLSMRGGGVEGSAGQAAPPQGWPQPNQVFLLPMQFNRYGRELHLSLHLTLLSNLRRLVDRSGRPSLHNMARSVQQWTPWMAVPAQTRIFGAKVFFICKNIAVNLCVLKRTVRPISFGLNQHR